MEHCACGDKYVPCQDHPFVMLCPKNQTHKCICEDDLGDDVKCPACECLCCELYKGKNIRIIQDDTNGLYGRCYYCVADYNISDASGDMDAEWGLKWAKKTYKIGFLDGKEGKQPNKNIYVAQFLYKAGYEAGINAKTLAENENK